MSVSYLHPVATDFPTTHCIKNGSMTTCLRNYQSMKAVRTREVTERRETVGPLRVWIKVRY